VIRRFRTSDLPRLREITEKIGITYEFPDPNGLITAQVLEDSEGNMVGFAGAQLEAQIFGVFDPSWGTPGERMFAFGALHRPIAEKLAEIGVKEAYIAVDTPAFGRRLMSMGWRKALWTHYLMPIQRCIELMRKKAA
jgi:hypothetical protein